VRVGDVIRAHGGSVREGVLRRSVGRHALYVALAEGEVVRSAWGTYSLPVTPRPRVLATQLRGVLSHRAAARHWGLALPPTCGGTEDVTIPHKAQRRNIPADVTIHYRDLAPDEVAGHVTTPLRTVLDCLCDLDLGTALSVGDSALRKGLVEHDELVRAAAAIGSSQGGRVRTRVRLLDARSANAFESTCRALLILAGLTGFEPQVTIRSGRRWLGRVDLAHRGWRILVECDGFEHHGERAGLRRDCRRHTGFLCAGWLPLRFSWEDVMYDPTWVVTCVRDAISIAAAA
jgi:very-short-patch-repair endonuclease